MKFNKIKTGDFFMSPLDKDTALVISKSSKSASVLRWVPSFDALILRTVPVGEWDSYEKIFRNLKKKNIDAENKKNLIEKTFVSRWL